MNENYKKLIYMQNKINKKYNLYFNQNINIEFKKLFIKIKILLQYFLDNIIFDLDYYEYKKYSNDDLNNLKIF